MKIILLYGVVFIVSVQCESEYISQTNPIQNTTDFGAKNVDVIRQLLNQETIIRMSLEQKVHTIMKDLLTLQGNVAVENNICRNQLSMHQEILELKKQVEWLKTENNALRNITVIGEMEILALKEKLRIVSIPLRDKTTLDVNIFSKETNERFKEIKKQTVDIKFEILDSVANNSAAISALETRHLKFVDAINNTISSFKASLDQYETHHLDKTVAVSTLEQLVFNQTVSRLDESTKIGFTASVSSSSFSWNSGTLVFPSVITNVGNGYNSSDGVFTAPLAGVYVFFVNVQSYTFRTIHVDIVLNGTTKVRTMAYGYNGNEAYEAGPNLVVLSLQIGDRVWVKHHSGQGYYYVGPITTFSGFLI